jgi:hypothetical protein
MGETAAAQSYGTEWQAQGSGGSGVSMGEEQPFLYRHSRGGE